MNLELLYTKIQHPETLGKEDIAPLNELCKKHPYSQLFDLLYLKALANNKDLHFEDELKKHAFKITDRTKLYDLIHTNQEENQNIETVQEISSEVETESLQDAAIAETISPEPEILTEQINSTVEPEEVTIEEETVQEENISIEVTKEEPIQLETETPEQVIAETEISSESIIEEKIETTEAVEVQVENEELVQEELEQVAPIETKAEETTSIPELEQEILAHIVANSYSLELEIQEKEIQENETTVETSEIINEEEQKTEPTPVTSEQKRSFSSWLKASSPVNKTTVEVKTATQNLEVATKIVEKTSEETPKEKESSSESEIINKFLAEEPEKIKPKTEFFSPVKKAKESLNEENLIYSETLANIYAMQGNYPKAILAFNQLILTNPEKKLYFAKKIEELNKKINS